MTNGGLTPGGNLDRKCEIKQTGGCLTCDLDQVEKDGEHGNRWKKAAAQWAID
jgi:hypothetical protein